jgi:DNA (cytosine-5)-methyltransferase 1
MGAPEVDANHYIPQGGCWWDGSDCADTLTRKGAGGEQRMLDKGNFGAVLQPTAYRWQNDALGLQQDDAVAALRASAGSSGFHEMNHPVIAQPVPIQDGREIEKRQNGLGIGQPGDPAYTVDTTAAQAVAFNFQGGSQQDQILTGDAVCPALAHASNSHGGHHQPKVAQIIAPSLTATNDPSRSPQSSEVTQQVAAVHASTMTVRRLSPRECERLQGFPDNWTAIPWRKKPAEECPDGPRYKALGNSMACNCMAWIGEQIAKWEADHA